MRGSVPTENVTGMEMPMTLFLLTASGSVRNTDKTVTEIPEQTGFDSILKTIS